jgi:hypothetical protein
MVETMVLKGTIAENRKHDGRDCTEMYEWTQGRTLKQDLKVNLADGWNLICDAVLVQQYGQVYVDVTSLGVRCL